MELYEAIFYRKSIRNFSIDKLKAPLMEEVKVICSNLDYLNNELNIKAHVVDRGHLIHFLLGKECKIKAPHYIVVTSNEGEDYLENIGFAVEKIVLQLTTLGLATCWIESKLKKEDIEEFIDFKQDKGAELCEMDLIDDENSDDKGKKSSKNIEEQPYIIIAFGYAAKNEDLFRSRKARPDRYQVKDMSKKLERKWNSTMELVRRSPSVKNAQPWFFYGNGNEISMYENKPKRGTEKMNKVSMGVALRHFDIGCKRYGLNVKYTKMKSKKKRGKEYFMTIQYIPKEETFDDSQKMLENL